MYLWLGGGALLLIVVFILVLIYHHNTYFVDHLNGAYGGVWHYDAAEDIYKDVDSDRTYKRKETE